MKRVILVVLALTGILAMADVPEAAVYVDPEYDRIWFEGEPEVPYAMAPSQSEPLPTRLSRSDASSSGPVPTSCRLESPRLSLIDLLTSAWRWAWLLR